MPRTLLTATAFSLLLPHLAGAQDVLDRVVPDLSPIQPLQVSGVTTFDVGPLSLVTGVPMGIERAGGSQLPPPTGPRVTVSGLILRNALDVMMRLEPGYDWREIDGVIVIRPVASWEDPAHPLRIPAPTLRVPALSVEAATTIVAALLGKPLIEPIRPGEGRTFNLDVRDGTMFDLMNAIVRAHGELAWSFYPHEGDASCPLLRRILRGRQRRGVRSTGPPGRDTAGSLGVAASDDACRCDRHASVGSHRSRSFRQRATHMHSDKRRHGLAAGGSGACADGHPDDSINEAAMELATRPADRIAPA